MRDDLSLLFALVLSEVGERFSSEQSADFLMAVGGKLARHSPLKSASTLEDLGSELSHSLSGQGLGTVTVASDATGLILTHDLPRSGPFAKPGWNELAALILKAADHAWLMALEVDATFLTELVSISSGTLVIRHGHART